MSCESYGETLNVYVTHVRGCDHTSIGKCHPQGALCFSFVDDWSAIHDKDLGCARVCDGVFCFEVENGASKGRGWKRNACTAKSTSVRCNDGAIVVINLMGGV
jgi:hypothetical protein